MVLEFAFDLGRTPNSRGIDQQDIATADAQAHIHRIARSAGPVIDDRTIEPGEPVQDRRLADVGPPDQREPQIGQGLRSGLARGQLRHDRIEQLTDAQSVRGRNESTPRHAQRIGVGGRRFPTRMIDFVDRDNHRPAGLANQIECFFVPLGESRAAIDDENHHIRRGDRAEGLFDRAFGGCSRA